MKSALRAMICCYCRSIGAQLGRGSRNKGRGRKTVRGFLMGMTFVKHERIWLRQSPDFSESWLHDRISDDPSVLAARG